MNRCLHHLCDATQTCSSRQPITGRLHEGHPATIRATRTILPTYIQPMNIRYGQHEPDGRFGYGALNKYLSLPQFSLLLQATHTSCHLPITHMTLLGHIGTGPVEEETTSTSSKNDSVRNEQPTRNPKKRKAVDENGRNARQDPKNTTGGNRCTTEEQDAKRGVATTSEALCDSRNAPNPRRV